ncbi:MAG: HupE/UreJ family protein [Arenicella sp.]|nr:HupE/UreJ family protein [Arenicella sp.]
MRNGAAIVALLAALLLLVAQPASAHTRSQSFSEWSAAQHTLSFEFAVDSRRVTQLAQLYDQAPTLSDLLLTHLRESLYVMQGQQPCELDQLELRGDGMRIQRARGRFSCPQEIVNGNTRITVASFFVVSPTHIHIAKFKSQQQVSELVLREGRASFVYTEQSEVSGFSGFLGTGFDHVLSGLDHIVFLIGLALVANRMWLAVFCITGFTLGHSITLALATLGLMKPDMHLIEILISFSIAVVALEAATIQGLRRNHALSAFGLLVLALFYFIGGPALLIAGLLLALFCLAWAQVSATAAQTIAPMLAVLFGLVHGAGFADGLQQANIFNQQLLMPLLGFNLGVELAQLLVLGIYYLAWTGLQRITLPAAKLMPQVLSISIFTLGCFWMTTRLALPL